MKIVNMKPALRAPRKGRAQPGQQGSNEDESSEQIEMQIVERSESLFDDPALKYHHGTLTKKALFALKDHNKEFYMKVGFLIK